MSKEGVSVIITAYDTADYIEECLDSIYGQSWFKKSKNWEVLVGVDHCEKTLNKMKEIMHKYPGIQVFYMVENVGTYITSNTLISKTKYDKVLRFDSDDIMKKNMVEYMLEALQLVEKSQMIQCYYENFPKKAEKSKPFCAHGVFLMKKEVYEKYGGFMPWKCAADSELLARLEKQPVLIVTIPLVLFYYRMHEKSLTKKKETSMHSDIRKQYRQYIEEKSSKNPIIETVTADCIEIKPEELPDIDVIEEICEKIEQEQPVQTIPDTKPLTAKPPKYAKRIVPTAKVIRKTIVNTYSGV